MEIPILDGFWTNESSKTNGWWSLFFTSETSPDPCELWWAVIPNNEQINNKEGGVEHQPVPHLFFLAVGPSWFTNLGFLRTPGECVLIHVRSAKLQTSTRGHVYLKRKGWYCWWFRNPAFTSWGWKFLPLFTGSFTSQVVVWDFSTINSSS